MKRLLLTYSALELLAIDDVRRKGEMMTPSTDPRFVNVRALDIKATPCDPLSDKVYLITPAGLCRRMKASLQTCRMLVHALSDVGIYVNNHTQDLDDLLRPLPHDKQAQILADALNHGIVQLMGVFPNIEA